MFLSDKKYRTPVSTYTDDYRPPCSMKKTMHGRTPLQIWKENKFVTQGLTMPREQSTLHQVQPEKLTKAVMQEYLYQNATDPSTYWPEKYWVTKSEEREVRGMLRRLSQLSSPSLQPVYTMSGRKPFQGYYSPCSGRHYCLRGMDYYVDGDPAIRRHLHALAEPTVRWDSSHFKKLGGVQRGSYTIHPEFASEMYYAPAR
ncbi:UNVERIFIED_CONTAM: hypothetical protein H355_006680 [Colinus virginianus]|nr:hypothetical protein H355_006680 [Colinus virginianus]